MARKMGEQFVITSDRIAGDLPSKVAPKKHASPVYQVWTGDNWSTIMTNAKTFTTMDIAVSMANALEGHDLAHSHTWYANLAGHLAKMTHGIPHVVTAHSLEPLRPWKAEQLGGGYRVSSWIEREAYEAADANAALQVLSTDLSMAAAVADRDVLHSHTWYANLAGHLAKLLHGKPHVMTSHSLEPLRPWKAEQLGGGYRVSSWAERTAIEAADAVIAVSSGMRADVLAAYPLVDPARVHVVHNGIDTALFTPSPEPGVLAALGLDPAHHLLDQHLRVVLEREVERRAQAVDARHL